MIPPPIFSADMRPLPSGESFLFILWESKRARLMETRKKEKCVGLAMVSGEFDETQGFARVTRQTAFAS